MREGYFNDSKPAILELEYKDYLDKNYNYNFNLFEKSKDKSITSLSEKEARNEITAYYDIWKKCIRMPLCVNLRMLEISKLLSAGVLK